MPLKHYKYSFYFSLSEMSVGDSRGIGTAHAEPEWEQQDHVVWGGSWEAMALPALAVWGKHIIACRMQS